MTPNSVKTENQEHEKPNFKEGWLNFALLTCLYLLQGVVDGLADAIPLVLQKRNVTYAEQAKSLRKAMYSMVVHPFLVKLLWAPIVDSSYYWRRVGRRKSWLLPVQYLTGILLLVVSMNVEDLLGTEDGTKKPNVRILTVVFFLCIFLVATQDIALDGWSLTMFKRKNIGYSALSQIIGFEFGYFLSSTGFIVLDSKNLLNLFRSVPKDHGLVTFAEFIYFWSIAFLTMSTLTLFLKKENSESSKQEEQEKDTGIKATYRHLWEIVKTRPVQIVGLFVFMWRVPFAAAKVASLKLIDAGIPRDRLVLLNIPSIPFQYISPFLLRCYVTGPRPLRLFLILYIIKLINGVLCAPLVFFVQQSRNENINTPLPTWYYWALISIFFSDDVKYLHFFMKTTLAALLARISDPRFGGLYLTLLNSMINFGFRSSISICLSLIGFLTIKTCPLDELEGVEKCYANFDGYYVEVVARTIIAAVWMTLWGRRVIFNLEKMGISEFTVRKPSAAVEDDFALLETNENGKRGKTYADAENISHS